jgi:hypothetical protein
MIVTSTLTYLVFCVIVYDKLAVRIRQAPGLYVEEIDIER